MRTNPEREESPDQRRERYGREPTEIDLALSAIAVAIVALAIVDVSALPAATAIARDVLLGLLVGGLRWAQGFVTSVSCSATSPGEDSAAERDGEPVLE